ncbi:MAG TPA: extracellular solute-binding protein [Chloroflexota bacterium]|nr:extracellular solute-binding protein [Chloroflexota bacterium]
MFAATRRTVIRSAASLGLTAPLVACAGGGAKPDPKSVALSGPTSAKVLLFNNALFTGAQDSLTSLLSQLDPQLKPDYILFPGQIGEFRTKMVAMYSGGDVPDAQWIHPSITSLSASKKLLKPLEDYARQDKTTPISEFYPGLLQYFRWQEQTYALPWYNPGYSIVYNKTLLDQRGVTPPDRLEKDGKWNWDAYLSTLRDLTRGSAGDPARTIGLHPISTNLDWICAWIWENGGDVFSKDAKKCVVNEAAAVEALQWYADLYLRYQVVNFGAAITPDFQNGFKSGRIGMKQANKEQTAPAEKDLAEVSFALGMAPIPKGKAGRANRVGTLGFGVANNAPNGDAGWRWVRFVSGPQAAAVFMKNLSTLPVRPRFAQLPEFPQSMNPWENKDYWLEAPTTARALAQPGSYNEIATLWNTTWADILAQKGTVKALVDDFARQANAMIAQEG